MPKRKCDFGEGECQNWAMWRVDTPKPYKYFCDEHYKLMKGIYTFIPLRKKMPDYWRDGY